MVAGAPFGKHLLGQANHFVAIAFDLLAMKDRLHQAALLFVLLAVHVEQTDALAAALVTLGSDGLVFRYHQAA